jgi:hypothetical protein
MALPRYCPSVSSRGGRRRLPRGNRRKASGSTRRPDSACHWPHGYPSSADPPSLARSAPRSSPHRLPLHARMRRDLSHADPVRRQDSTPTSRHERASGEGILRLAPNHAPRAIPHTRQIPQRGRTRYSCGPRTEGPLVFILLCYLKLRVRHVIMRTHDGHEKPWLAFDCAFGNIEPKFPPVAPLIVGTGNQLHDFHRSLAGLRRKCARSKLSNIISDFPFLPMQTIMLREDFDRGLPAVRSRRPDILC